MRRGIAQVITESGVATVAAVESGGSNANLTAIEESDSVIATVFLGLGQCRYQWRWRLRR